MTQSTSRTYAPKMDASRPAIDSAYSSLFTAGLLASGATTRLPSPRTSPTSSPRKAPPPPLFLASSNFPPNSHAPPLRKDKLLRAPPTLPRRRSSLSQPQPPLSPAALKSPSRAELRSSALHSSSTPANKRDSRAWPGFLKSVWTPPIAVSRMHHKRPNHSAPTSTPPSAPLPAPPLSPKAHLHQRSNSERVSSKGYAPVQPQAARRPLRPIPASAWFPDEEDM